MFVVEIFDSVWVLLVKISSILVYGEELIIKV